jgi:hypothetical protein
MRERAKQLGGVVQAQSDQQRLAMRAEFPLSFTSTGAAN